ncbi:MAG: hypothetical protein Q9200_006866 [Gallowayella weberi]
MEPVSLSIGATALLALLTTCVDCFEYIDTAKSCGRDLELLTTKFAIERTRLLIWGESVGLSDINGAGCESPHFRPIVEQILNCIRLLFEDTTALSDRYGLKPITHDASLSIESSSSHLTLPLRLKASYNRFKSRIDQNHTKIHASKKARWAIRDRQKFACLVEEIRQFVDGLEAVTESIPISAKRAALIREELSTVEDLEDLSLIAEASAGTNEQWFDTASIAIGASVCGGSGDDRIRDWMSEVSDQQRSTIADYEGSEPAWNSPEAGEDDISRRSLFDEPDVFKCPECPMLFRGTYFYRRSNLKRHLYYSHGQGKRFKCHVCNREFTRPDNLLKHCRNRHQEEPAITNTLDLFDNLTLDENISSPSSSHKNNLLFHHPFLHPTPAENSKNSALTSSDTACRDIHEAYPMP